MKLSLIVSRAIFSLGVLGSVSAFGADYTLNDANDFQTYFEESSEGSGKWVLKKQYKNDNLTFNFDNATLTIPVDQGGLGLNIKDITYNGAKFTIGNGMGEDDSYFGESDAQFQVANHSYTINADVEIKTDGNLLAQSPSYINGNVTISGSEQGGGSLEVYNILGANGSLSIDGTLNSNYGYFTIADSNRKGGLLHVSGDVSLNDTTFRVITQSLSSLAFSDYELIRSDSKITLEGEGNKVNLEYLVTLKDLLGTQNIDGIASYDIDREVSENLYEASLDLSEDGKRLSTDITTTDDARNLAKILAEEVKTRDDMLIELNSQKGNTIDEAEKARIDEAITLITAQKTAIESTIPTDQNGQISGKDFINVVGTSIAQSDKALAGELVDKLNGVKNTEMHAALLLDVNKNIGDAVTSLKSSGNLNEAQGIFDSLINSNINAKVGIDAITNKNFFKDVRESAKNSTDILNNTSSVNGAINISNDMALGDRIARINNPYSEVRFANVLKSSLLANSTNIASDAIYDYYGTKTYKDSVWANTFGGANIIDGESGGLYGISIGADKEFNENLLLGIYATYASSKIKDKLSVQESDNYQIGIYSSYRFNYSWELNSKLYGQIGDTKQDINLAGSLNNADFNRRFVGLNTNIGKVFNLENDLFLKPFVGVNYYYSHTPSYDEKGSLARKVESNTNNSLSLESGLEARKYFDESSYLFITPKIEQYVVNNGEDYVASFVGSNTSFSIKGEEKKKTYGQLIVGGNISLNDSLSLDVGIGAKQILAGKVDSKNETYLSGNVGIKYRF
jgi:hypothetical protein